MALKYKNAATGDDLNYKTTTGQTVTKQPLKFKSASANGKTAASGLVKRNQSNNPPAAKTQQGNALDLAKNAIANQQSKQQVGIGFKQQPQQNPYAKKVSALPHNPAALPKAQQIAQRAQGKTTEQLRQQNLQTMKDGLGTLPKSNVQQVGIGFKQQPQQPAAPVKTSMPAPAADTLQRAKQIPTRAGDSNAMFYAKAVRSGLGNAAAGLQNTYQMGKMDDAAKLNGEKTDFVNPFANMSGQQGLGDNLATLANNLATNFTAALDRNPGTIVRRWLTNNLVYTDEQAKEQGYANKEAMVEDVARKAMEATNWNDEIQQDFADLSQNKSTTQRYAASIMQNIAQMAPQIASNLVVPGSGLPMMAAQVYGNSAMEALDKGATLQQASNRGALSAATEVGTEKLFGGIPGLEEGLIKLGRVGNMLGEGVEEGVSTALSGAIDRATFDPTAENATAGDIARDALMGAAVSGVMQIPGMVTDIATDLNNGENRTAAKRAGTADGAEPLHTRADVPRISAEDFANKDAPVRDLINKNESQIYNWGIKKGTDTAYGGDAKGAIPPATYAVPNATLAQNQQTGKPQNAAENTNRPASLRQRAEQKFATDMESRAESAKNAEGAVADMLRDEDAGMLETEAGDLSDIAEALDGHGTYMNLDVYRVLDKVAGKNQNLRQRLHEAIEKPLNDAKGRYAQNIVQRMNDYKADMDRLGIKIGSKESAAVQWYGEGQRQVGKNGATEPYGLGQLQEDFPGTWQNIVEAEQIHRQIYDDYVNRINQALAEIYPDVEANANTELAKKQEAFEVAKERLQLQQELVQGLVDQANRLEAQSKSLDRVEGNKARQELAKVKAQMKKEGNTLVSRENALKKAADAYSKLNAEIESGSYFRNKRLMPRKDYFHHFVEMEEGLGSLKNILSRPSDIAPSLVGTSDNTKPKSKFWGALQRRTGAAYTEDAIAGMARYIPAAEYKINIDPVTAQLRGTVKSLVDATQQTRNSNGFIEFLTDYANDLAGKTNPLDRGIQKVFGRKAMKTLEWVNNRVKSNAVVGNLGSAVVQIGNIPNATTYIQNPITWTKAAATLANPEKANLLLAQSPFLTERYMGSTTGMFDQKNVLQKGSEWVLEIGDKKASELIWLAAYNQYNDGNAQGPRQYDNAIDYADDITRRSVAGRGVGEMPLTQKSRMVKLLAPFQVEVNNAYNLMKEQIGAKNAKGLIAYCASAWLTNALIEAVAGKRPIFDPIQALLDAIKLAQGDDEEKGDLGAAAKRLAGEAASNVPYISTFAPLFVDVDDMEKVFGEEDPTRYGTGMSATQEAFTQLGNLMSGKPVDVLGLATTYVTPYGGQQLERIVKAGQNFGYIPKVTQTEEGTQLKRQDIAGSYNDSGKLRFAMEPTAKNFAINAAFGEYATPEGKEYLENGSIMSDKNTDIVGRAPKEALLPAPTAQKLIQGMKGQTNTEKLRYISSQNSLTTYQKAWLQNELIASDNIKEKAKLAQSRGITLPIYYFVVNNGGSQEKTTAALDRCRELTTSQKHWMWQVLTGGAEKNNPYK